MKTSAQKDQKIEVRLSEAQKELLARAAALRHASLSEFVRMVALEAAETIVSDQRRFTMSPQQWNAFSKELDRPPRDLARLKKFLKGGRAFDDR